MCLTIVDKSSGSIVMGCTHSKIRDNDDVSDTNISDNDALYWAVSRGDYNNSKELLDKGELITREGSF